MSTLSIIVLSILAAIFGVVLLTAIGVLIWLLIRQHKLALASAQSFLDLQSALSKSLTDHASTLTLLSGQISATLEVHRSKFDEQISRIRGDKLEAAAQAFVESLPRQAQLASRIENAAIVFGNLVKVITEEQGISGSAIQRAEASGLGPESYAPAGLGEHYVSRSKTAAGDAADRERESSDNTAADIDGTGAGISNDDGVFRAPNEFR